MSGTAKRQWGKTEITGGRHAFRIGMIVRELQARVPAGAAVLDAGCGSGSLTMALSDRGYAMTAVDVSSPGLDRLKRKLAAAGGSGVRLFQASLTALPFPDAGFDAAVSGEVLEHLDDDAAGAAELYRVLRPGGPCFVTVPAFRRQFSVQDEWAGHKRRYNREGLQRLMEGVGFATEKVHYWGWPMGYIYDRFFFIPWLKRKLAGGQTEIDATASLGASPFAIRLVSLAFSFDRLFQGLPFGIGLFGLFRK
ncbi:MAG TPA: methyltransferase domain-containing protein [bacterium]|nr:methyltransferase domain-containing protein [bacterium]